MLTDERSVQRRQNRGAGLVLGTAMILLGFIGVPTAFLALVISISISASEMTDHGIARVAFSAAHLAGYLVAGAIWFSLRRVEDRRVAWALAVVGVAITAAASFYPTYSLGVGLYEEWLETQPGGRGHYGPVE